MLASHQQELMEDHCEERMQIYKNLVKEFIPQGNDGGGVMEETLSEQERPQVYCFAVGVFERPASVFPSGIR